jgi:hypothetical protein
MLTKSSGYQIEATSLKVRLPISDSVMMLPVRLDSSMLRFTEFAQEVLSYGCTPFTLRRSCLRPCSPSKARWATTLLDFRASVHHIHWVRVRNNFFAAYRSYGSTCLSSIVFWNALPTFWLSDAEAIKAVSTDRIHISKDVEAVSWKRSIFNFQVD